VKVGRTYNQARVIVVRRSACLAVFYTGGVGKHTLRRGTERVCRTQASEPNGVSDLS